ncbi:hypothetical protein BD779DRAFT_1148911 [Infundibulicybe gibba]|nr:hypothetical protein BD779DRAFT_1148911 [Infundibulicybe gibba]
MSPQTGHAVPYAWPDLVISPVAWSVATLAILLTALYHRSKSHPTPTTKPVPAAVPPRKMQSRIVTYDPRTAPDIKVSKILLHPIKVRSQSCLERPHRHRACGPIAAVAVAVAVATGACGRRSRASISPIDDPRLPRGCYGIYDTHADSLPHSCVELPRNRRPVRAVQSRRFGGASTPEFRRPPRSTFLHARMTGNGVSLM